MSAATKTLADLVEAAKIQYMQKNEEEARIAEIRERQERHDFDDLMQKCLPNVYLLLEDRRIERRRDGRLSLSFVYHTLLGQIFLQDGGFRLVYADRGTQLSWTIRSEPEHNDVREYYFCLALAGMPQDAELNDD